MYVNMYNFIFPYMYVVDVVMEHRLSSIEVLQCVAACCSVLQRVAACCSVLQRVAVYVVDVAIEHRHSYIDACMCIYACIYIHMQIGRHARHHVGFGGSRRPGACVMC